MTNVEKAFRNAKYGRATRTQKKVWRKVREAKQGMSDERYARWAERSK